MSQVLTSTAVRDGSPRTSPGADRRPATRDTSIDVLRGWFVVSMTIGHLAAGSIADKVSHAAVWLDGAIGFVTVSGLVLGMVYRRTHDRTGAVPYGKLLRRVRLLYLIQVTALVLALTVSAVSVREVGVGRLEQFGGWPSALVQVAFMRLPVQYLDVLPMYVVLLLATGPALALLSRSRPLVLLTLSGAVYVLATVWPDVAVPSGVHFNWFAWQLPFMVGLTLGWHWHDRGLAFWLRSLPVAVAAGATAAACFVTAQAFGRFDVAGDSGLDVLVGAAFSKYNLGPAHILFGFAAMAVGYAVVSALRDAGRMRPVRAWLALLGSRSLDAFVLLCLAVVVLPAVLRYESSSTTAMAMVVLTLGAQTTWVVLRRRGYLPGLATGTGVPARPLRGGRA